MPDELSKADALRILAQKRELGVTSFSSGLTRAFHKRLYHLPESVFHARGGKPTQQEATWVCDRCGEVEPKEYVNGFLPQQCACQLEQIRMEELRKENEARRQREIAYQQAQRATRLAACYNWLGDGWDCLGMASRTFENWNPDRQEEAYLAAVAYAGRPVGNLILFGESYGTGKSHLAAAICAALIEEGKSCLFTTATNLFNAFCDRIEARRGYSDLLKQIGDCDLFVIDDLNKIKVTEYKQSIFFDAIDKRNLRGKPILITTNARVEMRPRDVAGISEYIGGAAASRLRDVGNGGIQIVEMNGEDYRQRIDR